MSSIRRESGKSALTMPPNGWRAVAKRRLFSKSRILYSRRMFVVVISSICCGSRLPARHSCATCPEPSRARKDRVARSVRDGACAGFPPSCPRLVMQLFSNRDSRGWIVRAFDGDRGENEAVGVMSLCGSRATRCRDLSVSGRRVSFRKSWFVR